MQDSVDDVVGGVSHGNEDEHFGESKAENALGIDILVGVDQGCFFFELLFELLFALLGVMPGVDLVL